MKIFELVNFDPVKTNQDFYSYDDEIKAKYKQLGGGTFANVYQSDVGGKSYAVKVINAGHQGGPQKDALLYYYKVCTRARNKYFPRVYDIRTFRKSRDKMIYVVHMEKLQPFNIGAGRGNNARLFYDMERYFEGDRQPLRRHFDVDKQLQSAVNTIYSISAKFLSEVDFHEGNVMLRGSQLVITDPFCNT